VARMGHRIEFSILNETPEAQTLGIEFDADEYMIASNFRMIPASLWDELVEAFATPDEEFTKETAERLRNLRARRAAIIIKEWNLRNPLTGTQLAQPADESVFMDMMPPLLSLIEQAISMHYQSKEAKVEAVGED
jgi:hypothetical protein